MQADAEHQPSFYNEGMAGTVWRGYITFGLISFPVRLFRAARAERVNLRQLYRIPESSSARTADHRSEPHLVAAASKLEQPEPTLKNEAAGSAGKIEELPQAYSQVAPIRRAAMAPDRDEVLPADAITKGYEVEPDRYVTLEQSELKAIEPKTATEMELQEFIRLVDVDPIYFETSYYVRPEPAGEKAYAVLWKALQETGLVAIGKFAMHRREHVTILRSGKKGLIAHSMYFASEVRAGEQYEADPNLVAGKELSLAKTLINSMAGQFEPEKYSDTYRYQLEKLIASKASGGEISTAQPAAPPAPAIDIMEALQKSLIQMKKPPAKTSRPSQKHRAQ